MFTIVISKFETIFVTLVNHGLIYASTEGSFLRRRAYSGELSRNRENYMQGAEAASRKSYSGESRAVGIANRGRVIAAINRRRPLGRLSKLLSILKQNAFLRFIIVGVMTWSTLSLPPPYRLLLFDHHLRLLDLSPCCHLPCLSSTTSFTTTAMFRNLIVPCNTKRRYEISIFEQRMFHLQRTGGINGGPRF